MRRRMEIKYADRNRGTGRERESVNAVLYMRGGGARGGGEREREREREKEREKERERERDEERHTKGWKEGGDDDQG